MRPNEFKKRGFSWYYVALMWRNNTHRQCQKDPLLFHYQDSGECLSWGDVFHPHWLLLQPISEHMQPGGRHSEHPLVSWHRRRLDGVTRCIISSELTLISQPASGGWGTDFLRAKLLSTQPQFSSAGCRLKPPPPQPHAGFVPSSGRETPPSFL